MQAADVGLQDRIEGSLDAEAAQVHEAVDAFEQPVHGGTVGQFARHGLRTFDRAQPLRRLCQVRHDEPLCQRQQRRREHAAQEDRKFKHLLSRP